MSRVNNINIPVDVPH